MSRALAFVIALLAALVQAGAAFAHASLVRADPADGAVTADPPALLRLTFNEPVTPLVMRLIAPDGSAITPAVSTENTTVTITTPALRRGTHVLSWRVVSADGHPVGGSVVFSVGEVSAQPLPGVLAGDPVVRATLWAAKLAVYLAVFFGIGGAFVQTWLMARSSAALDRCLVGLLVGGLVATPFSLGMQGLDALDLRLPALLQPSVWQTGWETSYGPTASAIVIALLAALFALKAMKRDAQPAARVLSLAALLGAGIALSLSGHASNAAPQWLTRSAVFVHTVCVMFWIGALMPLVGAVRAGEGDAIARFSRVIPAPLVALITSGGVLAVVQLDRIDALWTTSYGLLLSSKLAAVLAMLALAAANRYVWVPRSQRGDAAVVNPLVRTIRIEFCIAAAVLALAALWRFTPPPRALAAVDPIEIHLHGARAMAQVSLTPVRGRDPRVDIQVLDAAFAPLAVKEVMVTMANSAAGIEPLQRAARPGQNGVWHVDSLRVPMAGQWTVRVDLLIDDFEKLVLENEVRLPRLP
jgi:copper transport protein